MSDYLALALSTLAVLALLGSLVILAYLVRSGRRAPQFLISTRSIDTGTSIRSPLKVSVIVAARNEEKMIEDCITSLLGQTYANLEIVAVDDSSIDSTLEILAKYSKIDKRLLPVTAGKKPNGWIGKTWPCWRGFQESSGDILLFVDADSTFKKDLIDLSVRYMERNKFDMFSLGPRVKIQGPWARAVLPLISAAINLLYPMEKVNNPSSKRAYVFGTFFLVGREAYEKTGGHSSVRGEIVEDAALGTLVKSSGYRLRIERGIEFLETVWEDDFRSIYVGLERVFSSSVRGIGMLSILNAVLLFFLMIYPLIFLLGFGLGRPASQVLLFGALACALNVFVFLMLGSIELKTVTGKISLDPFLYPVGGLVFICAIVSTTLKLRSNEGLEWKGQAYKLPEQKTLSPS